MLKSSVLVVAHPDDEILWFSSIVKRVDHIVICFLEIGGNPIASEGRARALQEFPLKQITVLGIKEAGVYDPVDWMRPKPSEVGLALRKEERGSHREATYMRNYGELTARLRKLLANYKNVITHNPWGEYGNAEHVQVYRAIKDVQVKLGFNVWISNYCSNKSFRLMESYITGYRSNYVTLATDKAFAAEVCNLYKRNHCWTWYDDFEWFNDESFIQDNGMEHCSVGRGHFFPLNVVRMELPNNTNVQRGRRARLLRLLARILRLPEPRSDM